MVLRAWLRPRNWRAIALRVLGRFLGNRVEALGIVLFVIGIVCFTVGIISQKPKPKETPKEEVAKVENTQPVFTVDMALAAVVRATSADKICYDSVQDAYYMHWTRAERAKSEKEEDWLKKRNGWYMMTAVPFLNSANGTWFIRDPGSIPDSPVFVDVTDLPCMKGRGKRAL